jgi:hypothetical protein
MSYIALFTDIGFALLSFVFAEVVRDLYHLAGHYWKPLQAVHNLHHQAYRRDLTISNADIYRNAQLYNDAPEAFVMLIACVLLVIVSGIYVFAAGCIYSLSFLLAAMARSQGFLWATDVTHKAGELVETPSVWHANRTYHWRHHFDRQNAYFSAHFTLGDKVLGTALSLKGKTIAITGASGAMGRALITALSEEGARLIALTTSGARSFADLHAGPCFQIVEWKLGREFELKERFADVDILIVNHGVNVGRDRSPDAIRQSYEVNVFSAWRLAELFFETVTESEHRAMKEVWINTSESEALPSFNPLYELSKRTLGNLITLRRLDAPCIVRKLVLGPFKSKLNPSGIMSPNRTARAVVALAKRDFRNIIVTINPLTYVVFPIKEFIASLYFRAFSRTTR